MSIYILVKSIDVMHDNYKKEFQIENNIIRMEIPKPLNTNSLIIELHNFLEKFKSKNEYQLTPSCTFDVDNLVLTTANKIDYLTPKEGEFLKYLLTNNVIITYDFMSKILWNNNSKISKNALRQFIKNINKKLPNKILKNIRGIGYKLSIDYKNFS